MTGRREATVRTQLKRARERLKRILEENDEAERSDPDEKAAKAK